jgi:hypothetical protein
LRGSTSVCDGWRRRPKPCFGTELVDAIRHSLAEMSERRTSL